MKRFIFALPNEKAEKRVCKSDDNELETRFPALLLIKSNAVQGELVNITLIVSENSPETRANFLSLMMELKALAQGQEFTYDLTEIRIAGEDTPEKQKRIFEELIEMLGNGEELYADITFGHKAAPIIIFTALSFCYTMRYFKIAIAILKCPALRGGGKAASAAVHTARASLRLA